MRSVLKKIAGPLYRSAKHKMGEVKLKKLARATPLRVIVGAGNDMHAGWIPTDIDHLDLLKVDDWRKFFAEGQIDAILAEHVWEHLTPENGRLAAANCYTFLKVGGYVRLAVPDGNHPSPEYIDYIRPGGSGAGADDHKVLYTYATFADVFKSVGFEVQLLEYFDNSHIFQAIDFSDDAGFIQRCRKNDPRNQDGELKYTSIIIDAWKRESPRQASL